MIELIEDLIERKIQEAIAKGEFQNLPGQGKPMDLNEDPFVPEELRTTYRILKNSGYKPFEVELKIELENLKTEFANAKNLSEAQIAEYKKRILDQESRFEMAIEHLKNSVKRY